MFAMPLRAADNPAEVNKMFGDIIKVTPSSKVVGDMALYMMTNDLSPEDVLDPNKEISFPSSVVEFFKGEIGIPMGGFPEKLQKKILGNEKPLTKRAGAVLASVNLDKEKEKLETKYEEKISNQQLASYLMYPKVWMARKRRAGLARRSRRRSAARGDKRPLISIVWRFWCAPPIKCALLRIAF